MNYETKRLPSGTPECDSACWREKAETLYLIRETPVQEVDRRMAERARLIR